MLCLESRLKKYFHKKFIRININMKVVRKSTGNFFLSFFLCRLDRIIHTLHTQTHSAQCNTLRVCVRASLFLSLSLYINTLILLIMHVYYIYIYILNNITDVRLYIYIIIMCVRTFTLTVSKIWFSRRSFIGDASMLSFPVVLPIVQ